MPDNISSENTTPVNTQSVKGEPIKTSTERLNDATQEALNNHSKDINNPYLMGRGMPFNAEYTGIDKYLTYNSETYGKLGFDPYKDNLKSYNDVTGTATDLKRGVVGAFKLAGVSVSDNIALGLAANSNSYKDFGKIMQDYSSEREGKSDFFANTILSAGYTAGILGTVAAEETALAAVTWASGSKASGVTLPAMATSALKGIKALSNIPKVGKAGRTLSALQDLSDVTKATWALGKFGRGALKAALPLGNTMDFVRGIDKLQDVNGLVSASKGVGALVRDARKFTMTHSESNMEANMARESYIMEQNANWFKTHNEKTDSDINQININADKVYNDTYNGNAALIYLSNSLLFDNMLKGATMTKNFFKLKELGQLSFKQGATGLAEIGVVKNGIKKFAQNELAKRANLGWVIDKTLSNSIEGFQEVAQDITSNSVKSYYDMTNVGKQTKGGWLSTINDNIQKQLSEEGLKTFASGALMGTIASPVGVITQGFTQATIGGGLKNQYNKLFNSKEYNAVINSKYDALKKKAEVLTLFFNDQKNYQDIVTKPFFQQANIQELIFDAASKGDKKDLEDLKHESFGVGVENMLKYNMENEFIGHLNYMADNFTSDQLNEAFGRNDITENNKSEFQQKLRNRVDQVKEYKKNFDEINDTIINPISISSLNKSDKNYSLNAYKYKAFENLKRELVLAKGTIQDKAARMKDLMARMNSQMILSSTDIMSLVNVKDLDQQLKLLKTDVEINKDLKKGEQTELNYANTVKRYEALKKYKEALTEYNSSIESKDPGTTDTDAAYEKLFEAFNEYTTLTADYTKLGLTPYGVQTGTAQRVANKQVFDNLFDYITLGQETSQYQTLVNTLLDPDSASTFIESNIKLQEDFEANKKEHIFELLKSFEDKKQASAMLNILYEKGVFFNLDEIDALIKDGIMPSELYDLKTNLPVSKEKQQVAQDIIAKFYKNLTGKSIVTSAKLVRSSAKLKSDKRKTAELLKQYGFKLGQEIDLSNKFALRKLVKNILKSKYLLPIDKEVLIAVLEGKVDELEGLNIKLKLVDNAELPISIDTDGTILLDVRYAANEYKDSTLTFENLFISAITQNKITDSLKSNAELLGQVTDLMKQVKDNFAKKYPGVDLNGEPLFNDVNLFLSEVLNNSAFQSELNKMVDTIDPTQKSLWKSLYQAIRSTIGLIIKNRSVLNRALLLASTAVKPNLVSAISQSVAPTTTEVASSEQVEQLVSDDSNLLPTNEPTPQEKIDNLNTVISEKLASIDILKSKLTELKGLFSFRKKWAIDAQLETLAIDVQELNDELQELQNQFQVTRAEDNLNVVTTEVLPEVVEFDIDGNILINNKTPFKHFPKDIKVALAKVYGKELSELTQADINEIRKLLLTKNEYISAVYDYVNEVENYYNELAKQNAALARQGKQQANANFAEYKKQKSQVNKGKKKAKTGLDTKEDLQKALKDVVDLSIFTSKEIDNIIAKLKDSTSLIKFTLKDVVELATSKKIKLNDKAELEFLKDLYKEKVAILNAKEEADRLALGELIKNEKIRQAREKSYQLKMRKLLRAENAIIRKNTAIYYAGGTAINRNELRHAILFNADKFRLPEKEFLTAMKIVKKSIGATANQYKDYKFKTDDIKTELIALIKKLNNQGLLYPAVVKNINKALVDANSLLMVRMLPTTAAIKKAGFEPLTYNYDITNRKSLKVPVRKGVTDYQKKKIILSQYEGSADELNAMVIFANTIGDEKTFQKEKKRRSDAVANTLFQDEYVYEETFYTKDIGFTDIVEGIYLKYDTLKDLVEDLYKKIYEDTASLEDWDEQNRIAMSEAILKKEIQAEELRIEFYNTDAGKKILEDHNKNLEQYYASEAFDISNGLYTGNLEDLSEVEQDLYDQAYDEGLYEEELVPYETLEPKAQEEIKLTENKENSLIDSQVELLYKEGATYETLSDFLKSIYTNVTTTYRSDVVYHLAILKFLNTLKNNNASKETTLLANIIKSNITNDMYLNQFVVLNGELFMIDTATDKEVNIVNLNNNEFSTIPISQFISSFENLIDQNKEFKKLNINTVVSNKEIDYIKDAYYNIFNNFTDYISSASKVSDEDLNNQIIDKFKTCT